MFMNCLYHEILENTKLPTLKRESERVTGSDLYSTATGVFYLTRARERQNGGKL